MIPASRTPEPPCDGASLPRRQAGARDFSSLYGGGTRANTKPETTVSLLLLCLVAAALTSCASSPAHTVLTSVNSYEFTIARYWEQCPGLSGCDERAAELRRWAKALDEANAALKRGGDLPLQLDALKKAQKAVPR